MTPLQAIAQLQANFKNVLLQLPLVLGNEAVNFTLKNFRQQGFNGASFIPWPKRKTTRRGSNNNGAILVHTGRLRRSVRVLHLAPHQVTIGTDVPYAKAHNEGSKVSVMQTVKGFTRKTGVEVKAHTRRVNQNLPRRQFMGPSPYLDATLQRAATALFLKALK